MEGDKTTVVYTHKQNSDRIMIETEFTDDVCGGDYYQYQNFKHVCTSKL